MEEFRSVSSSRALYNSRQWKSDIKICFPPFLLHWRAVRRRVNLLARDLLALCAAMKAAKLIGSFQFESCTVAYTVKMYV